MSPPNPRSPPPPLSSVVSVCVRVRVRAQLCPHMLTVVCVSPFLILHLPFPRAELSSSAPHRCNCSPASRALSQPRAPAAQSRRTWAHAESGVAHARHICHCLCPEEVVPRGKRPPGERELKRSLVVTNTGLGGVERTRVCPCAVVQAVVELTPCTCSLLCHRATQAAPGPRSEWETRYCTFSCSLTPHPATFDPRWPLTQISIWGKDLEAEGQV